MKVQTSNQVYKYVEELQDEYTLVSVKVVLGLEG